MNTMLRRVVMIVVWVLLTGGQPITGQPNIMTGRTTAHLGFELPLTTLATILTHGRNRRPRGQFKLLWFAENDRVELYDVESDLSEQKDLATTESRIASELYRDLHRRLTESGARMAFGAKR